MKHWILALAACGAVAAIPACSSDDSGGGTGGGNTGGGTGGVITGGTGGVITGGSGGAGNTGGSTGGSGNVGTGGGDNCPSDFQGQPCTALGTNDPKQTECIKGDCCDETAACLADAECSSFVACGSACLMAGGNPQSCGAECTPCMSSPTLYNAFTTCVTTCAASDGGTTDAGTGGSPGDAAAD
jgi:hypothetical protein